MLYGGTIASGRSCKGEDLDIVSTFEAVACTYSAHIPTCVHVHAPPCTHMQTYFQTYTDTYAYTYISVLHMRRRGHGHRYVYKSIHVPAFWCCSMRSLLSLSSHGTLCQAEVRGFCFALRAYPSVDPFVSLSACLPACLSVEMLCACLCFIGVCICAYVYIYMYIWSISTHMYIYTHTYFHIHLHSPTSTYKYIDARTHRAHACICVCMFMYMSMYMYMCMGM